MSSLALCPHSTSCSDSYIQTVLTITARSKRPARTRPLTHSVLTTGLIFPIIWNIIGVSGLKASVEKDSTTVSSTNSFHLLLLPHSHSATIVRHRQSIIITARSAAMPSKKV